MRSFWGCISICAAHLSWRVLPPRLSQVKYGANCVCVNGSGQVYSWIQREYPPSWRVQLSVVFRRVSLPTGVVHANAPLVGESSGCDYCGGTIKAAWMRGRFGFDIFRVELESVDSQHTHTRLALPSLPGRWLRFLGLGHLRSASPSVVSEPQFGEMSVSTARPCHRRRVATNASSQSKAGGWADGGCSGDKRLKGGEPQCQIGKHLCGISVTTASLTASVAMATVRDPDEGGMIQKIK